MTLAVPMLAAAQVSPPMAGSTASASATARVWGSCRHSSPTTAAARYRGALMPWLKYTPDGDRCVEAPATPAGPERRDLASPPPRLPAASDATSTYAPDVPLDALSAVTAMGIGVGMAVMTGGLAVAMITPPQQSCAGTGCLWALAIGGTLGYFAGNLVGFGLISRRMGGGRLGGRAVLGELIGLTVGVALVAITQNPWTVIPASFIPPLFAAFGSELDVAARSRTRLERGTVANLSPAVVPVIGSNGHVTGATVGLALTTF
jgi:hypothetical protein